MCVDRFEHRWPWFQGLWVGALGIVLLLGDLAVPVAEDVDPVPGGIPGEWVEASEFLATHLPQMHAAIQSLLDRDGAQEASREAVKRQAIQIATEMAEDYTRYQSMNPELAEIQMTIRRREYQNQIFAERIRKASDPDVRRRLFATLRDHMDHTFELNLRLVRGELAWFQQQVQAIRQVIDDEEQNKQRFIKEDLVGLLLENERVFEIGRAPSQSADANSHRDEVRVLIQRMPEALEPRAPKGEREGLTGK